jgi:PAS domain S-box-containing protein
MEMLEISKPFLIYLSYEDKEKQENLKDLILKRLRNVEVKSFVLKKELIIQPEFELADLIITDLCFNLDRIKKIYDILKNIHFKISSPFLFIVDNESIQEELLQPLQNTKLIYDFVRYPFLDTIIINRIRVLLSIPKILKSEGLEKNKIQENIWNVLNYSNMFTLILDKQQNIKLANYHLSHVLGFESEEQLIGLNWKMFIKQSDIELVKYVHEEILSGNEFYTEFTNDIINKQGKTITVKWFNSIINGGFNYIFSIGIPLTREPSLNEDIDSIRSYFADILQKDKTTINAMKEITMKYSNKIFGEKNGSK